MKNFLLLLSIMVSSATIAQNLDFGFHNNHEDIRHGFHAFPVSQMSHFNGSLKDSLNFYGGVENMGNVAVDSVCMKFEVFDSSTNLVATYFSDTLSSLDSGVMNGVGTARVKFWTNTTNDIFEVHTELYGKLNGSWITKTSAYVHQLHIGNVLGTDYNQIDNLLAIGNVNDIHAVAIRLGFSDFNTFNGLSFFLGNGSKECATIQVEVYEESQFSFNGFTGTPSYSQNFMFSDGFKYDYRDSGRFVYIPLGTNPMPLSSSSEHYVVLRFLNLNNCDLFIGNDQTLYQGVNSIFYEVSQARWFSGYVGSNRFNGPLMRLHVDGNVPSISLSENLNDKVFEVFPNPIETTAELRFIENWNEQDGELVLLNNLAQVVKRFPEVYDGKVLDFSDLKKGLYILQLEKKGRVLSRKKLMIK